VVAEWIGNLKRKEVTSMKYTKPQITKCNNATATIQSTGHKTDTAMETNFAPTVNSAYEADE